MNDDKASEKRGGQADSHTRPVPDAADTAADTYVGSALRSAYQETVDEGVPAELMNLLNRLD